MVWHSIGVYIINRTLHDRLEIRHFSSRVEKYFSALEEKFRISVRRVISSIYMRFDFVGLTSETKSIPDCGAFNVGTGGASSSRCYTGRKRE